MGRDLQDRSEFQFVIGNMPIRGKPVIPAQAGIQYFTLKPPHWIPAPASARGKLCAGMTTKANLKLIGPGATSYQLGVSPPQRLYFVQPASLECGQLCPFGCHFGVKY